MGQKGSRPQVGTACSKRGLRGALLLHEVFEHHDGIRPHFHHARVVIQLPLDGTIPHLLAPAALLRLEGILCSAARITIGRGFGDRRD